MSNYDGAIAAIVLVIALVALAGMVWAVWIVAGLICGTLGWGAIDVNAQLALFTVMVCLMASWGASK